MLRKSIFIIGIICLLLALKLVSRHINRRKTSNPRIHFAGFFDPGWGYIKKES